MQTGIQRDRAEHGCQSSRRRLPVTPEILRRVRSVWNTKAEDPNTVMVWAAATPCLLGFFRSGELTVPSRAAYNPHVHLLWGDVVANSLTNPTTLRIHLEQSKKCDQLGRGVDLLVGRTRDDLCPVLAMLSYMALRGGSSGPFFRFRDGFPLTKTRFIAYFRAALTRARIPCNDYSGHSFRSGAATAAAHAGLEDSMIHSWEDGAAMPFSRISRFPRNI